MNGLYGKLMLDIKGTSLSIQDRELIKSIHVGGIILFSRNFISRNQILDLCADIRSIKENIIIAVDQEGGRVQRFKKDFTKLPSMQDLANYAVRNDDMDICTEVGWLMASELIASGLDISFTPVLDIDRDTSSIIGNRSLSNNSSNVSKLASFFIDGMNEAGMSATGKHFPGHGGVHEDSHTSEPIDDRSYEELLDRDLKPFITLNNKLAAVMCAHITYPKVDNLCVGFSSFWLKEILRKEIGFNGVIFSDDLSMNGAGAESYTLKAMKSIKAGCDMVLACNNRKGAREILEYFDKEGIIQSKNISKMKKSRLIHWDDFKENERRLNILNIIKKI
tara:strand:- start:4425 stop:5429 length:1005 start_codon:yes stop_codon:yes gene_type:complete